jgi:hypothetical protein
MLTTAKGPDLHGLALEFRRFLFARCGARRSAANRTKPA